MTECTVNHDGRIKTSLYVSVMSFIAMIVCAVNGWGPAIAVAGIVFGSAATLYVRNYQEMLDCLEMERWYRENFGED